ncbi:GNAT family N-acetyltransferase [Metabacillus fastidiosus]|uniref:GNAT family N-acetyltransferase n=1 Tax=Metabacillus fastidiosus TaxID=1458 RepID=UPI002E1FD46E|nr:GNAT family N-acetyltransferase [Metabacillus fastidiosus]
MFLNLQTERLILRPFKLEDAPRVQELAGDKEVAKTTLGIPHPYPIEAAENWIKNHPQLIKNGDVYPLAIVLRDNSLVVGTMTLRVDKQHNKGELAYWVGKNYWGNGYATEAARAIMNFGFEELILNRIWATALSKNPASIKVMKKVGMEIEGTLKQPILQAEVYEDVEVYGVIKSDYRY